MGHFIFYCFTGSSRKSVTASDRKRNEYKKEFSNANTRAYSRWKKGSFYMGFERPKWFEKKLQEILADAKTRHVNTDKYNVIGSFKTSCCTDGSRKVNTVLLLHEKNPSPAPWAIKGIDGTRWFYDFNSAATFLVHVYGRKRPLTQRQYTQVLSALHKHQKSGEPFVMPELKKSKKLNP